VQKLPLSNTWLPEFITVLALLLLLFPLLPNVMRESDQASVLRGAYEIAFRGHSIVGTHFYHYDKMFGSYLVLAGIERLFPHADPVASANLLQFLSWIGCSTLLLLRARKLPILARALLLATMMSPVWVLSIPFFSPAAMSAYTLVAAYSTSPRRSIGQLAEATLVFLATSLRADAVLFLPFLLWVKSRASFRQLILQPRTILIGGAAVAALGVGPLLEGGFSLFGTPPRIIPKVVLAFAVFGLGPALISLFLLTAALARQALRKARFRYGLGILALALPLAYYAPQLLSPRYLLLTVTVCLCALTNRRMVALLSRSIPGGAQSAVTALALVGATVPVVLGFQLPRLTAPRLTITQPTTFPSADGHWPMGALAGFAYGVRRDPAPIIDHNQEIYEAARRTPYQSVCDGRVPLLDTPMVAYLELAVTLRDLPSMRIGELGAQGCTEAYADLRSLTHEWLNPTERDASPRQLPVLEIVSPPVSNQPIVLLGANDQWLLRRQLNFMREQFQGREFEVLFRREDIIPAEAGSQYQLTSPRAFGAETNCLGEPPFVAGHMQQGLYNLAFSTNRSDCTIRVGQSVLVGRTVLPPYMDVP
jgi:hypothetical protein